MTTITAKKPLDGCEFCDEFANGVNNKFYARYGSNLRSRLVLASENFRVFPSIGQLVEGYTLVAPVTHYAAIDEVPPSLLAECRHVYRQVKESISDIYGQCLCYEHGARDQNSGGCGIYHAHLHVVPFEAYPDPIAKLKELFPYKRLKAFDDMRPLTENLSSYLFYEDMESNRYLFLSGKLPSQYMRRLLAETIGTADWDWRSAGKEERLLATTRRLADYFDNCGSRFAAP